MRPHQHVLPKANIILDARETAAIFAPPVRRVGLVGFPTFSVSSIKENANLFALPKLLCQSTP